MILNHCCHVDDCLMGILCQSGSSFWPRGGDLPDNISSPCYMRVQLVDSLPSPCHNFPEKQWHSWRREGQNVNHLGKVVPPPSLHSHWQLRELSELPMAVKAKGRGCFTQELRFLQNLASLPWNATAEENLCQGRRIHADSVLGVW